MEPYDINAGRFYLRALHAQSTLDDTETLAQLTPAPPILNPQEAEDGWMGNTCYSWAVCELTSSDLLALVTYHPDTEECRTYTAGDPETVWDHNRELDPITLGEAAEAGRRAVLANL